jgi:type IV pilus assembly protein PilA
MVKSFKRGQKGFTLIELLIVIVILGVLAAAIIPNLSKFVGSGQVGAANAELASVKTAISAYQADQQGALPTATPATGGAVVNTLLAAYMTGTIKGAYNIDATGNILGTSTYAGRTWDATNLNWK